MIFENIEPGAKISWSCFFVCLMCVCCFLGDDFCCLGGNVAIVLKNSIFKCNTHNTVYITYVYFK